MQPNYLGSFTRYLNPYVLAMLDKSYQKWREQGNQKRACILTLSVYACMTWSGDIGASWEIYQAQIKAGLNYCYSGLPWWTFDVGGFVIGSYEGVFTYGAKDPAFQELYTRMFQFCTFCQIFRTQGSDAPREIWEIPQYKNVLVKFDNFRYRLMPYIYSIAAQTALNHSTMMRALPKDFSADKNTYSIGDQYMFGNALLIKPVTEYMYNTPPQISHLIPPVVFKTNDGKNGITHDKIFIL